MSLYVVGVGHCFPEGGLSNETLTAASGGSDELQEAPGILNRRSTITAEYLKESGFNKDPWDARRFTDINASHLGEGAARMALERAGITAEQVGLILADANTPIETTPGEAQRIGGRLGVKVPAYDVTTGAAGIAQMIVPMLSWKAERVPEYTLIVSTGVATQSVDYREANGAWSFGDGAAALVIAKQAPEGATPYCTIAGGQVMQSTAKSFATFPTNGHISFFSDLVAPAIEEAATLITEESECFGSYTAWRAGGELVRSVHQEYGDVVGAGAVAALSMAWDSLESEKQRLIFAGPGARVGTLDLVRQ